MASGAARAAGLVELTVCLQASEEIPEEASDVTFQQSFRELLTEAFCEDNKV